MAYILDKIASVIDNDTCKAVILCDETPETDTVTIDASDVTGLDGYVDLAAGSRIITPGADFIAFTEPAQDGTTTFKKKLSSGGGGSVTVETLTGNMDDVFAGMSVEEFGDLVSALAAKDATAYVDMDVSALATGLHIYSFLEASGADAVEFNVGIVEADPGSTNAYVATWEASGDTVALTALYRGMNTTVADYSSYASMLPVTITIVNHPIS